MKEQGRNLQRTVTALGDLYDRVGVIDGKGTPLGTEFRPIPVDDGVDEGDEVVVRVEEEEERVPEEPAAPAEEVVSDSEVEVVASPPRRSVRSRSRSSRRSRRSSPEV